MVFQWSITFDYELNFSFKSWMIFCGSSDAMSRSSTYMAMYSYLPFISLNQTHGLAFHGLKLSCSMMSWILCDHLKPELFKPYRALRITTICPCGSSNSGPGTMYSFSFVVASRYALPISVPQTSMLFNLARNIDSLRDLVETTPQLMLSIGSGVR